MPHPRGGVMYPECKIPQNEISTKVVTQMSCNHNINIYLILMFRLFLCTEIIMNSISIYIYIHILLFY